MPVSSHECQSECTLVDTNVATSRLWDPLLILQIPKISTEKSSHSFADHFERAFLICSEIGSVCIESFCDRLYFWSVVSVGFTTLKILFRMILQHIICIRNVNHEENTYLEEVVFSTLRSTILELKRIIVALVKHPLKEAVETHQYYLAYLSDEDLHCIHPDQTMSAEYLQVRLRVSCDSWN